MAYSPHVLVAFGGRLNTAQSVPEIWQCGVRWAPSGGSSMGDVNAADVLSSMITPMSDWFTGAGSLVDWAPVNCTLDWLKVNKIDAAGHYSDPTTHVHDYSGVVGSVSTATPWQPDIIAGVVTFRTARSRPPGAWGRIYLPAYAAQSSDAGTALWSSAGQHQIADAGAGVLAAGTAGFSAHDLEGDFVVASKVNASLNVITHVEAGNVMGVLRRRKNAEPETYYRSTLYGS